LNNGTGNIRDFYDSYNTKNADGLHHIGIAHQSDLIRFGADVSWKYSTFWSKEDGIIYLGHLSTSAY
jgi:hypothetical protein